MSEKKSDTAPPTYEDSENATRHLTIDMSLVELDSSTPDSALPTYEETVKPPKRPTGHISSDRSHTASGSISHEQEKSSTAEERGYVSIDMSQVASSSTAPQRTLSIRRRFPYDPRPLSFGELRTIVQEDPQYYQNFGRFRSVLSDFASLAKLKSKKRWYDDNFGSYICNGVEQSIFYNGEGRFVNKLVSFRGRPLNEDTWIPYHKAQMRMARLENESLWGDWDLDTKAIAALEDILGEHRSGEIFDHQIESALEGSDWLTANCHKDWHY